MSIHASRVCPRQDRQGKSCTVNVKRRWPQKPASIWGHRRTAVTNCADLHLRDWWSDCFPASSSSIKILSQLSSSLKASYVSETLTEWNTLAADSADSADCEQVLVTKGSVELLAAFHRRSLSIRKNENIINIRDVCHVLQYFLIYSYRIFQGLDPRLNRLSESSLMLELVLVLKCQKHIK